jgi:hypothetical protein
MGDKMITIDKVLICGGREFADQALFNHTLHCLPALISEHFKGQRRLDSEYCIIQGEAKGADRMAKVYAKYAGLPCMGFEANWHYYENAAGPIRNRWMKKFGQPQIGLAFPGGSGTRDMMKALVAAGVPVFDVEKSCWL